MTTASLAEPTVPNTTPHDARWSVAGPPAMPRALPARSSRPARVGAVVPAVIVSLSLTAWVSVASEPTRKTEPTPAPYMRLVRDQAGQPVSLQTSVTRFTTASEDTDLIVDLVSVVHIGEGEYYAELNRRFAGYDVVLYELVAPTGTRPQAGQAGGPIAALQGMMKRMLKLEFQLDHIDYAASNFVHADMSPAEMSAAMKARGETPLSLVFKIFRESLEQQARNEKATQEANARAKAEGQPPSRSAANISPLALLFDSNANMKLRLMMAEQFTDPAMVGSGAGLGKTAESLLVEDRNVAAIRVFGRELAKGHRRIAIFYGAAHMPDFEKRLCRDFDLKRVSDDWLTAWKLVGHGPNTGSKKTKK